MIQEFKIMVIDDDQLQLDTFTKEFNLYNEKNTKIHFILTVEQDFNQGLETISKNFYDILILDWMDDKENNQGDTILTELINSNFFPVIIYSGYTHEIHFEENYFCKIIQKGTKGFNQIIDSILEMLNSEIFVLKKNIEEDVRFFFKSFWKDFFLRWDEFKSNYSDDEIKILIINRLSFSLSREKFKHEELYNKMRGHPLSYYIYPPSTSNESEFEVGDIIKSKETEEFFVILTPSCDCIKRPTKDQNGNEILKCKADCLLLAPCINTMKLYKKEGGNNIIEFYNNFKTKMRYFYIPETKFIESSFIDFQSIKTLKYDKVSDIEKFEKVANFSYPFSQAIISEFISYYNRIGYEDMNIEIIYENLKNKFKRK